MLVKLLAIVSNSTLIFYIFSRINTQYVYFPPVNFLTVCNFLDGPFLSPGNFFLKKKTVRTESCLWYLGCVNEWKAYHNQKRVINMLWNSALASHKRIPFCCVLTDVTFRTGSAFNEMWGHLTDVKGFFTDLTAKCIIYDYAGVKGKILSVL